jgi:hypothetical protein
MTVPLLPDVVQTEVDPDVNTTVSDEELDALTVKVSLE